MQIGDVVAGRFRLDREVGRGGMGVVYAATQLDLRRKVALKVLHDTSRPAALARFRREAVVLAKLNHPHSVRVHEFIEVEGYAMLSMEFITGESLESRLELRGLPSMAELMMLLKDIATVLECAHELGIVHRDLKPANIMLEARPEGPFVRVVDFGIASLSDETQDLTRVTKTGTVAGTAGYMSPEQCRGLPADRRSDVYSLACLAWELLAGQPPFVAQSPADVLAAHLYRPPEQPSEVAVQRGLSRAFDAALLRGLAKRVEDRPMSAVAFVEGLELALQQGDERAHRQLRGSVAVDERWPIAAVDEAAVGVWAANHRVAERDMLLNALSLFGLRTVAMTGENASSSGVGAVVVLSDDVVGGLEVCRGLVPQGAPVLWCPPGDDVTAMTRAISVGVFDSLGWPLDPADAARRVLRALRRPRAAS